MYSGGARVCCIYSGGTGVCINFWGYPGIIYSEGTRVSMYSGGIRVSHTLRVPGNA